MPMKHISDTYSFKDFYFDDSIAGHSLLKPSIAVMNGYERIFSKIKEDHPCSAVAEVVIRVSLAMILPLAAVFAFSLALVALPIKGLVYTFSGRHIPETVQSSDKTQKQEDPELNSSRDSTSSFPSVLGDVSEVDSPRDSTSSSSSVLDKETLSRATEALEAAQKALDALNKSFMNIEEVETVQKALEKNQALSEVLKIPPEEGTPSGAPERLIIEEYQNLVCWIDSLERRYYFLEKTLSSEGTIKVSDNGNCLFESFLVNSRMSVDNSSLIQSEREKTVKWIEDNYPKDEYLQLRLADSIEGHYHDEIENNLGSIQGLLEIEVLGGICEPGDTQAERDRLAQRNKEIEEKFLLPLSKARGKGNESFNYKPIEELLQGYLAQMKEDGTFGGPAEIYALSCLHEVPVVVYDRNIETYFKFNEDFKSNAHYFQLKNKHYEPYFPK